MLIAYANIAWVKATGSKVAGIIRKDDCRKEWKQKKAVLPLRGTGVADTPSPLDAALYGPSLRRLNLLGQYGEVHTCRDAGIIIAEELDKTLSQVMNWDPLMDAMTVERSTVEQLANPLSLERPIEREVELLRALLFSYGAFSVSDVPPRVYTLLLLITISRKRRSVRSRRTPLRWRWREASISKTIPLTPTLRSAARTLVGESLRSSISSGTPPNWHAGRFIVTSSMAPFDSARRKHLLTT
jgi:hypothetical protein